MTIKAGDRIPDATLMKMTDEGPKPVKTDEFFKGRKVVLFALPGAFTPTCSEKHLPGFLQTAEQFKAKGVDEIWCVAVNDAFVMGAWGKDQGVNGRIRMLGDGSAAWTRQLGLEMDLTAKGLGVRSRRYSALIKDGVVEKLNVEKAGGLETSDADTLLSQI